LGFIGIIPSSCLIKCRVQDQFFLEVYNYSMGDMEAKKRSNLEGNCSNTQEICVPIYNNNILSQARWSKLELKPTKSP
jgi:hypothetical protein